MKAVALLVFLVFSPSVNAALAPVLGIDIGNEYMKISAIAPGHNLELILNTQSKRKTRTDINLANEMRQFGEQAFAQQTMQPDLTMQYWASNIGLPENQKSDIISHPNMFSSKWYPYVISDDAGKRRTIKFNYNTNSQMYFEDLMAHQLSHAKELVKDHLNDITYPDDLDVEAAFSIPVGFTYRQRQLLRQSANIAGIRPVGFVHEPMAAAISHSLDIPPEEKRSPLYKVFLDIGSKSTQACLAKFEYIDAPDSLKAGFGRQGRDVKEIMSVDTIKCATAQPGDSGAHKIDVLIAEHLDQTFLKANKLKDKDVSFRSRRRLLKDVNKLKHTLSTNKEATIFVEGYAKGKDLKSTMTRQELSDIIEKSEWLDSLTQIRDELSSAFAQVAESDFLKSIESVELIGGGWRVPRVLAQIESVFSPAVPGQKCNSDEAMAVGTAMVAANHSSTYKFKPILATTILNEPLYVEIDYVNSEGKSAKLDLDFPVGTRYGASRKRVLNLHSVPDPQQIRVVAKDNKKSILDVWTLDGISLAHKMKETNAEKIRKTKEKFANHTAEIDQLDISDEEKSNLRPVWIGLKDTQPSAEFNVSLTVSVNQMGLVSVEKAVAGWEDITVQETSHTKTVTVAPTETAESTVVSSTEATSTEAVSTDSSSSSEPVSTEPAAVTKKVTKYTFSENVTKQMKPLTISIVDIHEESMDLKEDERKQLRRPYPMTPRQIRDARNALRQMMKNDKEIEKLNELKNRYETYIYQVRGQIRDDEEVQKVSSDKQRTKLIDELQQHEDWLYEAGGLGANYSVVDKRLNSIKESVAPIFTKAEEYRGRDSLIASTSSKIEETRKKIATLQETKAWLKEEKVVTPVNEALNRFVDWFEQTQKAQSKLKATDTPVLTRATVDSEWKSVSDALNTFSKTKKPSRKKTEEL